MIQNIIVVPETRVRHIGLLDTSEFYRWVQRWLQFYGYWKDSNEKMYIETMLPGGGKKIEFRWECKRKKSSYFTYVIWIASVFIGLRDVEIQRDDKKIKLQRADFDIRLGARIEKLTKGAGFLRSIYDRFIVRRRIEEYKIDLYDKFQQLVNDMKEFMNVYA